MTAGMPAIAPTTVRLMATAAIHATDLPHAAFRARPNAPTTAASPAKKDVPIKVNSAISTRPTAEGSSRNPKTNQAHQIVTTAPTSKANQSQGGVAARG